jgi:sugar phosphate isomerase/epimerase
MASSNNLRLSIVLSTHQTQFEAVAFKSDFETSIAKIAGWGYDGVELAIRDPDLVDVDTLERVLSDHGLKVPAIGTGQAWVEERLSFTSPDQAVRHAAIARIKSHLPLAKQFNALVIIGLIRGITPPGQTHAQSMQYLTESLQDCTETAVSTGVRLALEPLNRYETDLIHTTDKSLELLDRVGSSNLGLLLDTFHMNIEEVMIEESIRRCGEHIFHFHVADSNRWYPGAGHLDFKSILNTLFSTGYQGWVSGEFMPDPDPDTAAQRSINLLRNILIQSR